MEDVKENFGVLNFGVTILGSDDGLRKAATLLLAHDPDDPLIQAGA